MLTPTSTVSRAASCLPDRVSRKIKLYTAPVLPCALEPSGTQQNQAIACTRVVFPLCFQQDFTVWQLPVVVQQGIAYASRHPCQELQQAAKLECNERMLYAARLHVRSLDMHVANNTEPPWSRVCSYTEPITKNITGNNLSFKTVRKSNTSPSQTEPPSCNTHKTQLTA